jgi:hypothetical protein
VKALGMGRFTTCVEKVTAMLIKGAWALRSNPGRVALVVSLPNPFGANTHERRQQSLPTG